MQRSICGAVVPVAGFKAISIERTATSYPLDLVLNVSSGCQHGQIPLTYRWVRGYGFSTSMGQAHRPKLLCSPSREQRAPRENRDRSLYIGPGRTVPERSDRARGYPLGRPGFSSRSGSLREKMHRARWQPPSAQLPDCEYRQSLPGPDCAHSIEASLRL